MVELYWATLKDKPLFLSSRVFFQQQSSASSEFFDTSGRSLLNKMSQNEEYCYYELAANDESFSRTAFFRFFFWEARAEARVNLTSPQASDLSNVTPLKKGDFEFTILTLHMVWKFTQYANFEV